MSRPRVILASASPRRRELLTLVGIEHEVRAGEHRRVVSRRRDAARARRATGAREGGRASSEPDAVTIGSDTIVVVDGDVLGKPRDRAHAAEMLRRLSGRSHVVMTGVAVRWRGQTRVGPRGSRRHVSRAERRRDRALHRHRRADGQGRRVRHSGIRRDDRRARRRRLLRRDGARAQSARARCCRELGLRYDFGAAHRGLDRRDRQRSTRSSTSRTEMRGIRSTSILHA